MDSMNDESDLTTNYSDGVGIEVQERSANHIGSLLQLFFSEEESAEGGIDCP